MKKTMIISRFGEDISWIREYNIDYIIYNKGGELIGYNTIDIENIGNNQRDIFKFIYENYNDLPDVMIFVQGNPFDHCNREKFNELIKNDKFTALESFDDIDQTGWNRLGEIDGGFMEVNNSWYVSSHNSAYNQSCKWSSLDDFMYNTFSNYTSTQFIRFTPGSQYIITKDIALHYKRDFWLYLMNILYKNNMTEGHIIERSLWMILKCNLEQTIC